MKKTLFVSDLDGTLLNADSRVSVATAKMINKAIAAGANFTIATARTPATVAKITAPIQFQLPLIVMTGAAMWDSRSGNYSEVKYFSRHTASQLLDIYTKAELPTFVYTLHKDIIHIYHLGCTSHIEKAFIAERATNPFKRFHLTETHHRRSLEIDINNRVLDEIILFYAMQPTEAAKNVYEEIVRGGVDCNPLFYHDIFGPETAVLEAFSPEATKAEAVQRLAKGIGAEEIVVFGDNVNDLPMMEIATCGVATGNAIDEVKHKADCIIGCNTEDSVARFILNRMGLSE